MKVTQKKNEGKKVLSQPQRIDPFVAGKKEEYGEVFAASLVPKK